MKKLANLKGAKALSKKEQQNINGGGIKPMPFLCEDICPTSPHGTECGPPHCPGMCDGNGGWVNY